jgi:AcrR family transcriptional regulator
MEVFHRFGFKKASMEDIAAAAGLSRQGLYLKFRTKERLFEAALEQLIKRLLGTIRAICAKRGPAVEQQLARIFEVLHADMLAMSARADAAELLEVARSRHGDLVAGFERDFTSLVAGLLSEAGVASRWAPAGITARQLAEHLLLANSGIKASMSSGAEYRDRMAVAVALVVRGAPAPMAASRYAERDRR